MSSSSITEAPGLPAPAAHRRERVSPALSLQVGLVTTFLLIIVVLPIAAVASKAADLGWSGFWEVVSSPEAVSALKLTLAMSTLAVLTTAVFGTIIAWVLVRDSFAGKSVVNAIIDLPFALPTIVAGLVIMALYGPQTPIDFTIGGHHYDANVTFTRGAIYLALLFVTLPFVVRSVQPVLIELDEELEEAARSLGASEFTTFRRDRVPEHPARDPLGRRDGVRARGRRDRRDRPHRGQPSVQDRGRLGLPLPPDLPGPRRLRGRRRRAPARLVRRPARDRRASLVRHEARAWVGSRSASPRLGYLALILIGPILMMVWRTAEDLDGAWAAITDPDTISAFKLTLMVTAIAVVVNTVFGIVCALLIVRGKIPGRGFLNAFVDLPLSLSPVIVGFALVSLYSAQGWLGWFQRNGYEILFATPSIILATIFVTLPFVVREVVPTLREIGTEQEQAAQTLGASGWQTFWRVTLPAIRWAVIYGVVLTAARGIGEFGAVAVVSGQLRGSDADGHASGRGRVPVRVRRTTLPPTASPSSSRRRLSSFSLR